MAEGYKELFGKPYKEADIIKRYKKRHLKDANGGKRLIT